MKKRHVGTKAKVIVKPDLTTWNLEKVDAAVGGLEKFLKEAITEALNLAIEEYSARAQIDGDAEEITLNVFIPIGPSDGDDAQFNVSLMDCVDNFINCRVVGPDRVVHADDREFFFHMRNEFQEMVNKLDMALSRAASGD